MPWLIGHPYELKYIDAPSYRPEFEVGFNALVLENLSLKKHFIAPRLACLALTVFGILVLSNWVKAAMGKTSALIVCALWCFCPNILAFGQTIVPDVGAASFGIFSCYAGWRYLHYPSRRAAYVLGVSIGLSLLAKLTLICCLFVLPAIVLLFHFTLGLRSTYSTRARLIDLSCASFLALLVLNAGYLFEDTLVPLGEFKFCSVALGGEGCSAQNVGNRFSETLLAHVPVPVPKDYLLGMDYLRYEVESKRWSFLHGVWKLGSWRGYYLWTTLYKTPEGTLIGAALGLLVFINRLAKRKLATESLTTLAFIWLPCVVMFLSISFQGGFNHHHRYVLFVYPALFTLCGFPCANAAASRKTTLACFSLVLLASCSSLQCSPHFLSYGNCFAGGPRELWRVIGGSNVDWGQDLTLVDNWVKRHPNLKPIFFELDYYGLDGELFGEQPSRSSRSLRNGSIRAYEHGEAEWLVVNVKSLVGRSDKAKFASLREIPPEYEIGYSFRVYKVQADNLTGGRVILPTD